MFVVVGLSSLGVLLVFGLSGLLCIVFVEWLFLGIGVFNFFSVFWLFCKGFDGMFVL